MAGELLTAEPLKTHRKPVKRLTDSDKAFVLRYHAENLTQVEIAQRIGCDQATVSRWLAECHDSTDAAGAYLRGSALRMAKNVVTKGQARDHIQALKGIGVLEQDHTQLNIAVGVSLPGLSSVSAPAIETVTLSPRD